MGSVSGIRPQLDVPAATCSNLPSIEGTDEERSTLLLQYNSLLVGARTPPKNARDHVCALARQMPVLCGPCLTAFC
jgi:hypothetical protein